jgi:hypothetical protein
VKILNIQELERWAQGNSGGLIVPLTHENFKMISYYLQEFAVETRDPRNQIGAFQLGRLIVVGRRWFLEEVKTGLGLPDH